MLTSRRIVNTSRVLFNIELSVENNVQENMDMHCDDEDDNNDEDDNIDEDDDGSNTFVVMQTFSHYYINGVLYFFTLLLFTTCGNLQNDSEHKKVSHVIDKFFKSIDNQDAVLFEEIVALKGQVWVVDNSVDPIETSVRTLESALQNFNSDLVIKEKALNIDIKLDNGVATAWVLINYGSMRYFHIVVLMYLL